LCQLARRNAVRETSADEPKAEQRRNKWEVGKLAVFAWDFPFCFIASRGYTEFTRSRLKNFHRYFLVVLVMDTMLTVSFPKPVYRRLQKEAKVLRMQITEVVIETVKRNPPLWFDMFPPRLEAELAQLDRLSISQLLEIAKNRLPAAKQRKLSRLLAKNSEGTITAKETTELDEVHLEANSLMLKKAKALALLKEKGSSLPISNTRETRR
jgi:hypothetical protein